MPLHAACVCLHLGLHNGPGPKTIRKNTNSTPNKSQTQRARAYDVTSFLSTDCELSTNPCSRFLYSLGPCSRAAACRDFGKIIR